LASCRWRGQGWQSDAAGGPPEPLGQPWPARALRFRLPCLPVVADSPGPLRTGREAPDRGAEPGLPVPSGGTCDGLVWALAHQCDGEGKPITSIALLPLCYPSNTGPFLPRGHFVAPVRPPFTNFLVSEIRAKTFDGGIVRTEGRPGCHAGLSFWNLPNRAWSD